MMKRTKIRNLFFVGIGGTGMNGIAEVLLNQGFRVRGSDLRDSDVVRRLASLGAETFLGHQAENVRGSDVVVVSSAVHEENVEVREARRLNIPVIRRAEMLAELMRTKHGIAVAGAHGKTTTTSMIAQVLTNAGLDPTVVIGGKLSTFGSNVRLGQGDLIVAEADESDGSFLRLSPAICVVTNIDAEHLDYYRGLDQIKEVFLEFINRIPFYGLSVLCLDDPALQDLIPRVEKRRITYGLSAQADVRAVQVEREGPLMSFRVIREGNELGPVRLNMPGIHNLYNSLAAISVGLELDVPFESAASSLQRLGQVHRRIEILGTVDDIMVVDDYGHHPTEIRATLEAVHSSWGDRRIVVVFQPHRYSRSFHLHEEFVKSFYQADHLVITEIYAAGETPIEGVSGESLYRGIRDHGHKDVHFIPDQEEVPAHLLETCRPGDLLLTLGAGNINRVAAQFLAGKGADAQPT
jgi:UDP-N-acetylmuramate--alanine ligase